eukprot:NODE_490_length_6857_cov_0.383249.p1 type:complete len:433 gc:universal NODE_490_length_6857_cov_0.383249:5999-4701(-)
MIQILIGIVNAFDITHISQSSPLKSSILPLNQPSVPQRTGSFRQLPDSDVMYRTARYSKSRNSRLYATSSTKPLLRSLPKFENSDFNNPVIKDPIKSDLFTIHHQQNPDETDIKHRQITLVDIDPNINPSNLLIDKFEAISYRDVLQAFKYTYKDGFRDRDGLNQAIRTESNPSRKLELQLLKILAEIKHHVDDYDYNRKDHTIKSETEHLNFQLGLVISDLLKIKFNKKVLCTSGNFRFPPNPGSIASQSNYAGYLGNPYHIDGAPALRERFGVNIDFQIEQLMYYLQKDPTNPLYLEKYNEMVNYWKPFMQKSAEDVRQQFTMVNLWAPLQNGPVSNYPLGFMKKPLTEADFKRDLGLQRKLTHNDPFLHFGRQKHDLCIWDKMQFGDILWFDSLELGHKAVDLHDFKKKLPIELENNRKSFEMRCIFEK